jgi:hypothetical protein
MVIISSQAMTDTLRFPYSPNSVRHHETVM